MSENKIFWLNIQKYWKQLLIVQVILSATSFIILSILTNLPKDTINIIIKYARTAEFVSSVSGAFVGGIVAFLISKSSEKQTRLQNINFWKTENEIEKIKQSMKYFVEVKFIVNDIIDRVWKINKFYEKRHETLNNISHEKHLSEINDYDNLNSSDSDFDLKIKKHIRDLDKSIEGFDELKKIFSLEKELSNKYFDIDISGILLTNGDFKEVYMDVAKKIRKYIDEIDIFLSCALDGQVEIEEFKEKTESFRSESIDLAANLQVFEFQMIPNEIDNKINSLKN